MVRSDDPYIDNSTTTCISSSDVNPSASNPLFTTMIDDFTNSTFAVQIYYGDTMDNETCKQLEKVLFTYFPNEGTTRNVSQFGNVMQVESVNFSAHVQEAEMEVVN